MTLLNEFLKTISMRADDNDELHAILRDFLEPDTNDKKIHGGAVIRTVNFIFYFSNIYDYYKRRKKIKTKENIENS